MGPDNIKQEREVHFDTDTPSHGFEFQDGVIKSEYFEDNIVKTEVNFTQYSDQNGNIKTENVINDLKQEIEENYLKQETDQNYLKQETVEDHLKLAEDLLSCLDAVEVESDIKKEHTRDESLLDAADEEHVGVDDLEIDVPGVKSKQTASVKSPLSQKCKKTASTKSPLSQKYKITIEKKMYNCDYCKFKSDNERQFFSHYIQKHSKQGNVFKCHYCLSVFTLKVNLSKHLRSTHGSEYYNCKFCEFQSKRSDYLLTHMRRQHTNDFKSKNPNSRNNKVTGSYTCFHCKKLWTNRLCFLKHIKTHADSSETFRCGDCDYTAKLRATLQKHIKERHDANRRIFTCSYCPFLTHRRDNFIKHFTVQHGQPETYACKLCDYTTKVKIYLKTHIKAKHDSTAEVFACKLCSYQTRVKKNFNTHMQNKHANPEVSFECTLCDYKTHRRDGLRQHIKYQHEKVLRFVCNDCGYRARQKCTLILHLTDKNYKPGQILYCADCSFQARFSVCLSHHRRVIHPGGTRKYKKKEKKMFMCSYCMFQSHSKSSIGKHTRSEHKEKVNFYNCVYCGFETHMFTYFISHFLDKDYYQFGFLKCFHCGFTTETKEDFRDHVKNLHNKNMIVKEEPGEKPDANNLCLGFSANIKQEIDGFDVKPIFKQDIPVESAQNGETSFYQQFNGVKIESVLKEEPVEILDVQPKQDVIVTLSFNGRKPKGGLLKCPYCPYSTENKHYLRQHFKVKHDANTEVFQCASCSYNTKWKYSLINHIRAKHTKEEFRCKKCNYKSKWKQLLSKHVKNVHL